MIIELNKPLSSQQLEARLRAIGEERYHNKHPFHKLLHSGKLTKLQIQAWALNRYCYQAVIPKKDAAIMARIDDSTMRRQWRQRVIDHDGDKTGEGGIERWLRLAEGVELSREYVISQQGALPITQFAVQAYLHFVSEKTLLEAVASSLTEMFSPKIIAERIVGMLENYDFIDENTLAYFTPRLTQARRDVDFALAYVLEHALTCDQQTAVLRALEFKCDMLWSQLDALYLSYVSPGLIPPGCFGSEQTENKQAIEVLNESIPKLADQVKLAHDKVRKQWILQAPERIIELNETAVEIIKWCDGRRCVKQIVAQLSIGYMDAEDAIANDTLSLLQMLTDKRFIQI